jgi:5-oxoprolinase (ATP-hydrolysing) subunit A
MRIDLNADVGESLGQWPMGDDEALIPLVTSVNIACGFHAGDPRTIERTVAIAVRAGVAIGAHPGYPDLVGFGRRDLAMAPDDLEAAIVYQVGAVATFARAAGSELRHVKAHGALYNRAARDPVTAEAIVRATRRISTSLVVVGPDASALADAAAVSGSPWAAEAFPDRAYEADGTLRSRLLPDAMVLAPDTAAERAVRMVREGIVVAIDGSEIEMQPDTLCLHGDAPGAPARAAALRRALAEVGIEVRALGA